MFRTEYVKKNTAYYFKSISSVSIDVFETIKQKRRHGQISYSSLNSDLPEQTRRLSKSRVLDKG
jgi:hypothetical protein